MEADKTNLSQRINSLYEIIKNGLFWHGVRNQLAKIGIDFMPYYWEVGYDDISTQEIRGEQDEFQLLELGVDELRLIKSKILGIDHKDLVKDLNDGDTCLGVKYNGTICAYSFVKCNPFLIRKRKFHLKPNEGYVHSTYTFEDYRGLNLAPYLRQQNYRYHKAKGVNTFYSISEYFNKPTLRYKRKLNIKPLNLFLSIILFKRWYFNFTLKTY